MTHARAVRTNDVATLVAHDASLLGSGANANDAVEVRILLRSFLLLQREQRPTHSAAISELRTPPRTQAGRQAGKQASNRQRTISRNAFVGLKNGTGSAFFSSGGGSFIFMRSKYCVCVTSAGSTHDAAPQ
jgi:hypothetical protein